MLSLNISYLAYWIKNSLSLKIRIHYTVLNAAGYKLKLLYLSSYRAHLGGPRVALGSDSMSLKIEISHKIYWRIIPT